MASHWQIHRAARAVRAGGVIAYPTEAVWGLGCDPWNAVAVQRLLALKSRDPGKGLILVAASIEQFDFLLEDLPERWLDRLASTWPGPHTWLVPHQQRLPAWISGMHETVALRVSAARSRLRVQQYFGGQLDEVLGGALGGRKNPSTIRDLATAEIVRPA